MRLGIRLKQVLGVVATVGLAIVVFGIAFLASLTHMLLDGSRNQAKLLSNVIYQRTFNIVGRGADTREVLRLDEGLQTVLESYAYTETLVHASIVDPDGKIIADADPARLGMTWEPTPSLDELIDRAGFIARFRAIYTRGGRTFEMRMPIKLGETDLGSIRVGVSTLLLQSELTLRVWPPFIVAAAVLIGSGIVAVLLAQVAMRPIHVIRGGLARLGRGEVDVSVDLPADTELGDLGDTFKQLTARLAADRTERAGQRALESAVDRLEDAVALFGTDGALRFANTAMKTALGLDKTEETSHGPAPHLEALLAADHPYRVAVERALAAGTTQAAPITVQVPDAGERLVQTSVVPGESGKPMGVLLASRNLAYLSQVESTLSYSRKLGALNRLTAGIAHEIKNPLNATMIHLELLKMQVADLPDAMASAAVIADQVRRLDDVVQGFLKFSRPEDLQLESVNLSDIVERIRPIIDAEAEPHNITLNIDVPASLPPVDGDPRLLEQAFLNLALNGCQAMPNGGRLTISARAANQVVAITVGDTGIGIEPEHLSRIFDLYYTTKPHGSGIGLSLVFRTVQLHNGEIEVQSVPGEGTTFRIVLPQTARMPSGDGR